MARMSLVCLFLLYVMCSYVGRASNTTHEIHTRIVTPEADRKEGRPVKMECLATNFDFDKQKLMWINEATNKASSTGEMSDNGWYVSMQLNISENTVSLEAGFSYLQKEDSGHYNCSIIALGTGVVLNTSRVTLSVLYFPGESFPVCPPLPDLPVDPGTELIMQCSSDPGNPAVTMDIAQTTACTCHGRNIIIARNGTVSSASLTLTVDVSDDGKEFMCSISSVDFPGEIRSCTFGPIRVRPEEPDQSPIIAWMATFIVTLLLLVVSMGLNLLLLRTLKSKPRPIMNNNILHGHAQEPWPQNPDIELHHIHMDATPQHTNEPEEVSSYGETEN